MMVRRPATCELLPRRDRYPEGMPDRRRRTPGTPPQEDLPAAYASAWPTLPVVPSGVRRRDRRGRGVRGPLLPPHLPGARTRAERFDELVLGTVERLERSWAKQLAGTEFAVEDVPPSDPAPWEHRRGVPMGRYFPADGPLAHRIVVYRRPIEERAVDREELAEIVRTVVVEQVAHMLGRGPEEIDPGFVEGP